MKKINYLMICLMATLVSMTFASCEDEDAYEAKVLSGEWTGDFGMYYEIENRYGKWERFDSYDTDIVFYPDNAYATHGYGKQIDYYRRGPYEYQYYNFYWSIRNGVIYLDYPYDPELNTAICNYRLYPDYFEGWFDGSDTKFRLRKLVDFDWSYYNAYDSYYYCPNYTYYYDYFPYYYAKSRGSNAESGESAPAIKHGNRFNEKK